jgi:hypothetical protein
MPAIAFFYPIFSEPVPEIKRKCEPPTGHRLSYKCDRFQETGTMSERGSKLQMATVTSNVSIATRATNLLGVLFVRDVDSRKRRIVRNARIPRLMRNRPTTIALPHLDVA